MHLGHVHLLKNGIPLRRTAPIARTASRAVAPTDTTTRTPRAHAAIPAASCRFHSTSTGTTGAYASIRSWEASRAPPAPSDRPRSRSHSIKYKRPLRANVLGKPHILQTLRHLGHCSLAADAETDRRVVWKLREDFLRSAEAEDAFSAFVERSVPVGDEGGIAEEEIARSESERREVDMASNDDAYAAFLDKANQPAADATAQQQEGEGKKTFGTKSVDREVPHVLQQVEEYYVSDADEPFEGVSLGFGGGELSAGLSFFLSFLFFLLPPSFSPLCTIPLRTDI